MMNSASAAKITDLRSRAFIVLFFVLVFVAASALQVLAQSAQPDTLVRCDPEVALGTTDGIATVELYVENVEALYGADVRLQFDPEQLQVVDAQAAAGLQIKPLDNFLVPDFLVRNEADNDAGTIIYAAAQLSPREAASGSGPLARVALRAVDNGSFLVSFTQVFLSTAEGIEIPATAQTCTVTFETDPCPPQDEVWIDDDYSSSGDNDDHIWGCNAFANIAAGVEAVNEGGIVNVLKGTYQESLTLDKRLTLAGQGEPLPVLQAGGAAAVTVTAPEVVVKGLAVENAATALLVKGGELRAYANNFTGFDTAVSASDAEPVDARYNWWGSSEAAPAGVDSSAWQTRLAAPIVRWREGEQQVSLAEPDGQMASLAGGTGKALIVNYGRPPSSPPPFGNAFFGYAEETCSDFYEFITINGSGDWRATLPVDDVAECEKVLFGKALYWIPPAVNLDVACLPGSDTCWQILDSARVSAGAGTLQALSMAAAELGGTPMVAGAPPLQGEVTFTQWIPVTVAP